MQNLGKTIYLDNAATTKPCESAKNEALKFFDEFYNPSSIYVPAIKVAKEIQNARSIILNYLGDSAGGLVFTSGATEANNLAVFQATKNKNKVIVTTMGEHPSVFNAVKNLENQGYRCEFVPLLENGEMDLDAFAKIIEENDVGFVSVMFVNNETGAINKIKEIGKIIKNKDKTTVFHVDAVQAFTKIPINVKELGIDMLTISSHKIHGLKGTGALYFSSNINIKPSILGGGQEFDRRSGTENISGICAFAEAVQDGNEISDKLKQKALEIIADLPDIKVNGDGINSILNISAKGVKAEVVVRKLDECGVLISTGSACNSHKANNRVLSAMGVKKELIEGTNRFSFSKYTTMDEVEYAFSKYAEIIKELRSIWEKF